MVCILQDISEHSSVRELGDFFEVTALRSKIASKTDIGRHLGMLSDNEHNEGCEDDDSERADALDEVLLELEARERNTGGSQYPFTIDESGTILSLKWDKTCRRHWFYIYLLLSTNLNMSSDRSHAGIDGTALLEELSVEVIRSYLGDRSRSMNFGTSVAGGFGDKVDNLCREIGEGCGYDLPAGTNRRPKDGKLDTVCWIPFSDERRSKLIVFGQCKTGTSWRDSVAQLQPQSFMNKYFKKNFSLVPVRAFFISEAIETAKWNDHSIDAGLLFDRCRLVDFCPENLEERLFNKLKSWTKAALDSVETAHSYGGHS